MNNKITDFKGVIPAVLSVFDENEELDEKEIREFIRYLMSFDIGGLYLTGSTGETFLMSSDERKKQVEIVMDEVDGKLPVVVHVGAISTRASVDLAKHAESVGAAAISSVPPFYFKFSDEEKFTYYKDIAESTALPMIVYNIPLAGMMPVEMIRRLSEIDNVKGIKYTGTALYEVMQIRDLCKEDFLIYGGCDELGSSNIAIGVDGIIGSFYNCIPDHYIKIWNAVKSGNQAEATRLQKQAVDIIMTAGASGSMIPCIKLWLRAAGVSAGYSRRPFTNFTQDEREKAIRAIIDLDEKENIGTDLVRRIKARR